MGIRKNVYFDDLTSEILNKLEAKDKYFNFSKYICELIQKNEMLVSEPERMNLLIRKERLELEEKELFLRKLEESYRKKLQEEKNKPREISLEEISHLKEVYKKAREGKIDYPFEINKFCENFNREIMTADEFTKLFNFARKK